MKRNDPRQWSDGAAGPSLRSVPDVSWMGRSACRGMDPEPFTPPGKALPDPEALAVCGFCPVRAQCHAYALDSGRESGIWGGVLFEYGRPVDLEACGREMAARVGNRGGSRPPAPPRVHVTSPRCDGAARHARTGENTRKLPGGSVRCLDCERDRCRRYRQSLKEAA